MSGPGAICTDVLGRFRASLEPSEARAVSRRLGALLEAFRASCSSSLSALNQAAARIRGQISEPLFPEGALASTLERLRALDESLRAKREAQQALDGAGVRAAGETWVSLAQESAGARAASDEAWQAGFLVRRDSVAREHATALELYRSVLEAYQRATGAASEGRSGIPSLLDEREGRTEKSERPERGEQVGQAAGLPTGFAAGFPVDFRAAFQAGGRQGGEAEVSGGAGGASEAGEAAGAGGATAGAGVHGLDALLLDF